MCDKNRISTDTLFLFSLFSVKDKNFSLKSNLKKTVNSGCTDLKKNSKIYEILLNRNKPWISKKISTKIFNNFGIKNISSLPIYVTFQSIYYAYYIEFNQQNYGGILLEPSNVKEADKLYSTNSYYNERNHQNSDNAKYNFYEYLKNDIFKNINYIYISAPTPTKEITTLKLATATDQNLKLDNIEEDVWINSNKEYIKNPFFPMLFNYQNDTRDTDRIRKLITGNFDPTIDEEMNNLLEATHIMSNESNIYTTYKYYFAPDCDGCAITTTGKSISPTTMLQCLNIFIILTLQRTIISAIKEKCLTQKINRNNIKYSKELMRQYKEKLNLLKEYTETAQYLPSISGSFAHHLYKKKTYDMLGECNEANEMCNSVLKDIDNFKQGKLDSKLNIIAIMAIISIVWDGLSLVEHIFHFTI